MSCCSVSAYGDLRNLPLVVCDTAGLVGQRDTLGLCRDDTLDTRTLALYSNFKSREDPLTPEERELLARLKKMIPIQAPVTLERMRNGGHEPVDAEASAATSDAVASDGQRDDAASKPALRRLAERTLTASSDIRDQWARDATKESIARWREISRVWGPNLPYSGGALPGIIAPSSGLR